MSNFQLPSLEDLDTMDCLQLALMNRKIDALLNSNKLMEGVVFDALVIAKDKITDLLKGKNLPSKRKSMQTNGKQKAIA